MDCWFEADSYDYQQVQNIIERLESLPIVELPKEENIKNFKLLLEDIDSNIKNDKPELVIDRLHSFASEYLRNLCYTHSIGTSDVKGNEYPIHSLAGMIKKWYVDNNNYFDSEFAIVAIQNAINLFDKFNCVRNEKVQLIPTNCFRRQKQNMRSKLLLTR